MDIILLEVMKKRNLSGIYFRTKVDGKWDNVVFEDLPEAEQDRVMEGKTDECLKSLAKMLAQTLRKIGDQFDIVSE